MPAGRSAGFAVCAAAAVSAAAALGAEAADWPQTGAGQGERHHRGEG